MNWKHVRKTESKGESAGLAHWLLERLRGARRDETRLALVERISLAPRQTLALVEAEGRRFLIASSPEGAPAFYPLDGESVRRPAAGTKGAKARISW